MDAQELRNLQEAYLKVVENQQLDEISAGTALSASKKASEVAGQLATLGGKPEDVVKKRKQAERLYKLQAKKRTTKVTLEDVDIYDIILSHLLDEGYADTKKAAQVIMVNMSEEWRESIVEARKKVKIHTDKPIEYKIADIGPGGKEYNVKTSKGYKD
jgi:hypothetical protein